MNAPFLRQNRSQSTSERKQRIEPLSVLPVFFNLQAKQVLVIGGTDAAAWKAELLAAAGAKVYVHAARLSEDFEALIASAPRQFFKRNQHQLASDIADAHLLICDAPSESAAKHVRSIAKLHGVPVNIIDQPEFCDFQFGSIVNRSPAVIAISTSGAAPIFGQAIRRRIEMILPKNLARWAQLAQNLRDQVNLLLKPGAARRTFWETFVDRAFSQEVTSQSEDDLLTTCRDIAIDKGHSTKLTRIGYCTSDPELITIKAIRALQSADVIVHGPNTPAPILELARREAKRICVDDPEKTGKPIGKHVVTLIEGEPCRFDQAEIAAPKTTSCAPATA
ncbi:NAD(P)-dependent oxidoreductase [Maritalea porphyrae]|uniref:NAD(P)-dependent oxidoreductase n=1 Tax=Maritalea porphyrae TaxID=880732 RepID=UPI0022AF4EDC|nr:NAD(P)-dependent oxidoreductase [Maritalea porphyrae]MCZ4271933.1 siroheme synthase [Maritalea porphyrae]